MKHLYLEVWYQYFYWSNIFEYFLHQSDGSVWGMLGDSSHSFHCFLHSWADDGRGCGACEHSGQLESGGQDHPLHQDTREEEDIWQRQLPVSYRYYSSCVCESVTQWVCLNMTHHLLSFFSPRVRENQANSRDHRCFCECRASVSSLWGELIWSLLPRCILNGFVYRQPFFPIHTEGAGGGLGG